MNRLICVFAAIFLSLHSSAWAIATVTTGTTYKTTEPTNATISHWTSGWGNALGLTGWDYVGYTNYGSSDQASAVYLGDGWVLTAAHVNLSNFTLSGVTYAVSNVTSVGTSDLKLFKIPVTLSLPALAITGTQSLISAGSSVVMIGNGGGTESWGVNTVTNTNLSITINPWTTTDFATKLGSGTGYNNTALLVNGDSGGADFYYDNTSRKWYLVGINEAVATDGNGDRYSCMVDLSKYIDQIDNIMLEEVPEPSAWALLVMGALACVRRARRNRQ